MLVLSVTVGVSFGPQPFRDRHIASTSDCDAQAMLPSMGTVGSALEWKEIAGTAGWPGSTQVRNVCLATSPASVEMPANRSPIWHPRLLERNPPDEPLHDSSMHAWPCSTFALSTLSPLTGAIGARIRSSRAGPTGAGNPEMKTPTMDRLAVEEGVRLERHCKARF